MIEYVLEVLGWMGIAVVKFAFTPSAMVAAGYNFWETAGSVILGGWLGVVVFYYSGDVIFNWWDKKRGKSKRKSFSVTSRWMVFLKSKFGVWGLSLTIGLVSIPLGSLLVARYFRDNKLAVPALMVAVIGWTLLLTGLSFLVKHFVT